VLVTEVERRALWKLFKCAQSVNSAKFYCISNYNVYFFNLVKFVPCKTIIARIVNICNRKKRLLPEKFETAARAANTDDGSTGICLPEHITTRERPISRNLHIASGGAIHRCLKCF